jgi:hypothetical protein
MPVGRAAQFAHDRVDHSLLVLLAPVGDCRDDRALALEQGGDRLVDGLRGQQVPRIDRGRLPDSVAAILGLVVRRRRPVQLEERDIRRARQGQTLAGDSQRADDQLVRRRVRRLKLGERPIALRRAV